MSRSGFVATAVALVLSQTTAAFAEVRTPLPAEIPPLSYEGAQYVDSKGCVFIRAGLAGTVNWVPRVSRDRKPLCGFEPSLGGPVASPLPADVPVITVADTPAPEPVAPAAAPVAAASMASSAINSAPTTTLDPIATVAAAPVAAAPVTAAPVAAAPVVTPQVTRPEPRRVTLSEICAGQYGILSGYINASTGQPVDCGPAPAPVVAMAPATPAMPTAPRACENIGSAYLTGGTGREVRCGPQTQALGTYGLGRAIPASNPVLTGASAAPVAPVVSFAPVAPSAAMTAGTSYHGVSTVTAPAAAAPVAVPVPAPALPAASGCAVSGVSAQYMRGADVRCGPQTQSPSGSYTTGAVVLPEGDVQVGRSSWNTSGGLFTPEVPASNPTAVVSTSTGMWLPAGYAPIWQDERLNPMRGIPGVNYYIVNN